MSPQRQNLILIIIALILVVLFSSWFTVWDFGLVDDGYIPMTYARNIAQGHGIVFFPGGEKIEGYTSPLWTFWLTLCALCHLPLTLVSQATSLLSAFGLIVLSIFAYRNIFYDQKSGIIFNALFWPIAAGLAVASDISLAAYSLSGMETTAYSFILLLLCYALIRRWPDIAVCILMLIISITRPEGPAFWFLCLAYWLFHKRLSKSLILLFITTVVVPYSLFIGFRFFYFGQPLPNTFYAKHNFGGLHLAWRGLEYTYYFFRPRPLFLFAVFGLLLERKTYRAASVGALMFVLLHTALVTMEGGDHFTLHRFLIPAIAFFSILSIRGLQLCIDRLIVTKFTNPTYLCKFVINTLVAVTVLILIPAHGTQLTEFSAATPCNFAQGAKYHLSTVKWTRSWANVGIWLKEKYPPETLIAVINAGAIPYHCELRCIDMLGLNDSVIAHTPLKYENLCLPGHDKSNSDYVLECNPQLIQLFPLLFFTSKPYPEDKLVEMITYPAQMDMWQDQRFHQLYEYRTEETRFGFISFFERK
jgi:hypothetical protein